MAGSLPIRDRVSDERLQLAIDYHKAGKLDSAEQIYRSILTLEPEHPRALHLLGMLLLQSNRRDDGLKMLRRAAAVDPTSANVRSNLGAVLGLSGRSDEAISVLREAVALRPDWPEAHNNLGVALEAARQYESACEAYRHAIHLRPTYAEAHNHLGNALRLLRRLTEAVSEHRIALQLKPNYPEAYRSLAQAFTDLGDAENAAACFRQAILMRPDNPSWHSDLLFALHHVVGMTPQQLFQEHLAWAKRHALASGSQSKPAHVFDADFDRILRIGYVSPDFRSHPTALVMEPLLANHDKTKFDIFCYADVARPDAATHRLRALSAQWRDVSGLSTAQVADSVKTDGIDILVDLAGHCGNRLLQLFTMKPAPIQATYYGYLNSTGLSTIDFRLTDALMDPPGPADSLHTERLIRLPDCAWCYRPHSISPDCQRRPRAPGEGITFGCLNRPLKINHEVARLWVRLLREIPDAQLLVTGPDDGILPYCLEAAAAHNSALRQRIRAIGRRDIAQYLSLYGEIDIALDPFPHNGGATTLDALWMGVPVVTLAGETCASRIGVSLLSAVGLQDCIATCFDEYIRIASELSRDHDRLASLRNELRNRFMQSPLRDEVGHARKLEAAYRAVWLDIVVRGRRGARASS